MFTFLYHWPDLIDKGLFTIDTKNICRSSYVTVSMTERVTKDV